MKKSRGFTLIELLIVTVVIVTLMGIVFRLAGTGSDSKARATTVSRLQKLSNALSGYYAAFGSYPPVPLQGRSRDIYTRVDGDNTIASLGYGIQAGPDVSLDSFQLTDVGEAGKTVKRHVEAACRAQPVAAGFPYNQRAMQEALNAWNKQSSNSRSYRAIENYGGFKNKDSSEWSENSVFMFGLMSFLLPRYQFMLDGDENIYINHPEGPWESNNRLPFLMDGSRLENWNKAQGALSQGPQHWDKATTDARLRTMLESLPSQAVCARWMPNFAGIVTGGGVFFGVDTEDGERRYLVGSNKQFLIGQGGYNDEYTYIGGVMTVRDGWNEDFYYYSLPPYQSYQLWSSGPDKRTFPPWFDKSTLSGSDLQFVNKWTADDIKVGDK